jgi:hypothetical protein
MLLGSVSNHCLHHARGPVVFARARDSHRPDLALVYPAPRIWHRPLAQAQTRLG